MTDENQAVDDINLLIETAIRGVTAALEDDGAVSPHILTVDRTGEVEFAFAQATGDGGTSETDRAALIDHLRELAEEGAIRAAALVTDNKVRVPDSDEICDAVVIDVDSAGGHSCRSIHPYRAERRPGDRKRPFAVEWLEHDIVEGEVSFFGRASA